MLKLNMTKALAITGAAALLAIPVAMADELFTADTLVNDRSDPYIIVREVEGDNVAGGVLDLRGQQPGRHPERLGLYMANTLNDPVNIRIPDLKVSYLVPANTNRVAFLNMLAVGVHSEVPYTVDVLRQENIVQANTTSISELIDTDNSYTPMADPEPTYIMAAPADEPEPEKIRGYW